MPNIRHICFDLLAVASAVVSSAAVGDPGDPALRASSSACRKSQVVVLGAGVAGITAAQALHNASITDFIIIEYQQDMGGRMKHAEFGKKADGSPYVIELGANWVQGVATEDGYLEENPIWTFTKKWNVTTALWDESLLTYDENGPADMSIALEELSDALPRFLTDAGSILSQNLQDRSARAGFDLVDWKPGNDSHKQALEWMTFDAAIAQTPEEGSQAWSIVQRNATYNVFGASDMFCTDQRGFNTWLKGEASTFLDSNDSRLALNTVVTKVNYTDTGVVVETSDGNCFEAEYAIVTLPLGVLQSDTVKFSPAFPSWKKEAIATFRMGTYLKMFIQFNETFWNSTNENMLYASPTTRGYLAEWHNIGADNIHPGSNMLLVTAMGEIASRIERQTDEETRAEVIAVLQQMFPDIVVPEPIAFLYPRWGLQPYSFGTYSHWPAGASLEMHQNLRANVGRVFFAGEAQSTQYFSFLQRAWFEGRESGQRVAGLLGKNCSGSTTSCGNMLHYETLHATTQQDEFKTANGWYVDTF